VTCNTFDGLNRVSFSPWHSRAGNPVAKSAVAASDQLGHTPSGHRDRRLTSQGSKTRQRAREKVKSTNRVLLQADNLDDYSSMNQIHCQRQFLRILPNYDQML
jgi:hypothetical protein